MNGNILSMFVIVITTFVPARAQDETYCDRETTDYYWWSVNNLFNLLSHTLGTFCEFLPS